MLKKILVIAFFSFIFNSYLYAEKTDSIIINKLNIFTDEIIELFENNSQKATVAVADFINNSEKAKESNIGYVVSDIINQRLTETEKFVVVESSQIDKIIDTLQLELSGLYDEKTVSSIGNLVGAEYMVLGAVTDIGGFYRINIRVIKIETGITILNKNIELDSYLLEKESQKYLPPKYRIMVASTITYNPQDFNLDYKVDGSDYNIGISTGIYYDFKLDHTLSLIMNYYVSGNSYLSSFKSSEEILNGRRAV